MKLTNNTDFFENNLLPNNILLPNMEALALITKKLEQDNMTGKLYMCTGFPYCQLQLLKKKMYVTFQKDK